MITPENLYAHELTGLHVRVYKSCNPQMLNVSGTIVRESKNMFHIATHLGQKIYPKRGSAWEFKLGESKCVLDGAQITYRTHERSAK